MYWDGAHKGSRGGGLTRECDGQGQILSSLFFFFEWKLTGRGQSVGRGPNFDISNSMSICEFAAGPLCYGTL